jgi:hypothetical protein
MRLKTLGPVLVALSAPALIGTFPLPSWANPTSAEANCQVKSICGLPARGQTRNYYDADRNWMLTIRRDNNGVLSSKTPKRSQFQVIDPEWAQTLMGSVSSCD